MPVVKMKYGIDLGTTNSSLCKFEDGVQNIIKTDTLKETMPSCVSFTPKRVIKVGDSAFNDLCADRANATKVWTQKESNVFIEFKRTMGLDRKYKSTNMKQSYTSEDLSAEVLKKLLSFESDEKINACVVTIPAKFKSDQIAATMRAANLAGIKHCELLQEPIAAAIAYGVGADTDKDGIWLVFDFGGGTFDAALINVQDGILQVRDTEGDNYLGGKNIDFAIVDNLFIPYLKEHNSIDGFNSKTMLILREGLKFHAEQAKNALSSAESYDVTSQLDEFGTDENGNELELDLTITQEELRPIVEPFFQKAIDICRNLIARNNLTSDQINSVILVGGPTQSPVLREMLAEQLTTHVDTRINPMTAVTLGAATYASTIDYEEEISEETSNVVALDINYEASTVETVEFVTIRILPDESIGEIPSKISVELERGDGAWSSGKIDISDDGEVIECYLQENVSNTFTVKAYDENGSSVNCFPRIVTILQGTKIINAVLPYYLGIEVRNLFTENDVFASLTGLEKNVLLPAVGISSNLGVPNDLIPGNTSTQLVIPIYQGEYDADGTSAVCNDHVFDVVITGEDITTPVTKGSDLNITIKVDRSQMMVLEATFGETNETVEKPINVSQRPSVKIKDVQRFIKDTRNKLNSLKRFSGITEDDISYSKKLLADIKSRYDAEKSSDDGRMHLLADIRRAYLSIERIEKEHAWELMRPELESIYNRTIRANNLLGNKFDAQIEKKKKTYAELEGSTDIKALRRELEEWHHLFCLVTFQYQLVDFIRTKYIEFDQNEWTNPKKAKNILAKGYKLINAESFNQEEIFMIINELRDLIIESPDSKPLQLFMSE